MNYEEAIAYIHSTYRFGSKLGLENIRFLLKLMGNPQSELRFIHVCGLARTHRSPFTNHSLTSASQSGLLTSISFCRASRSMTKNPTLWRVSWYFLPGLPRPTINFTDHFPLAGIILPIGFRLP